MYTVYCGVFYKFHAHGKNEACKTYSQCGISIHSIIEEGIIHSSKCFCSSRINQVNTDEDNDKNKLY